MKLLSLLPLACLALQASGAALTHRLNGFSITEHPDPVKRAKVQEVVTWDNQSLYVHGERIMIYSGEFHPFRLPVTSLYSDIFQKIKAIGLNCVSFYYDWALVEGTPGTYRGDGIFDLQPFFDAASEAGIYLLARPGPYINAEASGGGFPGWTARLKAILRTNQTEYLEASNLYLKSVSEQIAKGQITNGGPVILYQPENEYTGWTNGQTFNPYYMQDVMNTARAAGIDVPFISNDASPNGNDAPGSGVGAVDIYGHDSYPLGFDCAHPSSWPAGGLPTDFHQLHEKESPSTPYSIVEFQAGSFDPWGGPGFAKCTALTNEEFERVFYKNNLAAGVALENHYMIFGGTNWGNLGHPGGYTSYDYGSAITEARNVTREKYSGFKLIANFLKVSPSYLDILVGDASTTAYTSTTDLTVTPLIGQKTASSFYVVRHTDYTSEASTSYTLKVSTSAGSLQLPQLGGSLSLNGRDSKIHVTDYPVGKTNILYSTAEVFTWKQFAKNSVLVIYGGPNEHHEFAVSGASKASVVEGSSSGVTIKSVNKSVVVAWDVSSTRRIVQIGNLLVLLLDRNSAYNYWTPEISKDSSIPFSSQESTANSLIVNGGYLIRSSSVQGSALHLSGDFNATTTVEVIGVPAGVRSLYINGAQAKTTTDKNGFWSTVVEYRAPKIQIPSLSDLDWKYIDTLPEIQSSYDDSHWVSADNTYTNNTIAPLQTPTSLYGQDYGFSTGYLLFRGHFVATGAETTFTVNVQGGTAYGHSVWLEGTFLGSWAGNSVTSNYTSTFTLPNLTKGKKYVFTVLLDNMGLDEDWTVGTEESKDPRGILNYELSGHSQSDISWKLTGNFGGEHYADLTRGPLNEGGLYAERQGWHQPDPPVSGWKSSSPLEGLTTAGVGFYTASFDLNLPRGWDVPLWVAFGNSTTPPANYRVQFYVNGYQYGKYVNQVGPETAYPVPQGILNYQGTNWLAVTLWAQDSTGAKLEDFALLTNTPVLTALSNIEAAPQPKWTKRAGAY